MFFKYSTNSSYTSFLMFIFVSGNTFGDAFLKILKKLFFLHQSDLMDYVSGKKNFKVLIPDYNIIDFK